MTDRTLPADKETIRKLAVDAFNHAWTLMDQEEPRTHAQDLELIRTTQASRYLWGFVGEPEHFARGEWQISRAYALIGRAEAALTHADRCVEILEEAGIGDWDIAFAHEAVARAYAVGGDSENAKKQIEEARRLATAIKDDADRDAVLADLATIQLIANGQ